MWFGTFHGIARYDGYSIISYTHQEGDTTSIANAIVEAICDDNEGNIWVGHSRGLDKFNPSTGKFTHYILNSERPLTDWSQHVMALHEDRDGTLWIGTGFGLYIFNKSTETFTWIKQDSTDSNSLSSNNINAIYEDRAGSLWFATGNGLNKVDQTTKKFNHYWVNHSLKEYSNWDGRPYWVLSILEDSEEIIWLGTTGGVVAFNKQDETFTLYKNDPKNLNSLANNTVLSICEDNSGFLWISTKAGLDIFDKKSKKFSHNTYNEQEPHSLSSNDVGRILLDRSGTIWISTYGGGVNKFNQPNNSFRQYSSNMGKLDKLPPASIETIVEDLDSIIWIGMDKGLLRFNPRTELFEHAAINEEIPLLLVDKTGTLWISTLAGNLFYKNNKDEKINQFFDSSGKAFYETVSTMCNSNDGGLWLGTTSGKILKLNPTTRKVEQIAKDYSWIESIHEDKNGLLWIGTRESGLIEYDPVKKTFKTFSYDISDPLSISGNRVTRICEDKRGTLWIIANQNLNKFETVNKKFIRLREKDGFPKDIYNIIEDVSGNLWMSTVKGTIKYNPITNQFKEYDDIKGFGFKMRNGELYFISPSFISNQVITRFYPDSLLGNTFIPPVVITSFLKFEKPFPFGKEIQLSYDENFISFEFSSLSYISPERNQYVYKMEGIDKDWVYSGTRRFASYPNLNPGEYIFRVKGSNNDGVWNEAGTSITIIISPPFWKTWWAYLSYTSLFIFTLYGIRRYEMNRISYKNQVKVDKAVLIEKEETEKIKSRFFANISHEFRTPLTLILGPAEKIISDTSDDIKKEANIIKRNSRRLLQLINQLLDLSKLESGKLKLEASKGNIVSFVKGVALSFESLAESKDITLKLLPEKDFIELYFDREKMMKILTNLLSNAFKFTPEEGTVTVSVKSNPPLLKGELKWGSVEIKIKDTGIGIPQEEIPKLFDRFYQVDSSFTKEHEGTGIGLALTKELVELHHGIISVESKQGEWSEFTVSLPVGKNHLNDDEIIKTEKPEASILPAEQEVYTSSFSKTGTDPMIGNNDGEIKTQLEEKTIILVVEDNYDMREYIKESLDKSYQVEEAVNGEQGVRKAEKIIPDLIISDMMMPKMDGNELVRILKNDEKTSHIPIILLTARSGQENKIEGLETGADDYLTKPFDVRELRARIENLIKIRRKLQAKYSKLEYILRPNGKKGTSLDEKFMIKVGEVIEEHISEEEFNIEEFCGEVAMSRTQLHRKLKALTGKSATLYVRTVKLSKAKKMIEEKTGNISEIAYSLGFSSPAYFTRCFKEEFGYPPSDIKR
ncbi:MAG TPA: two-component regulator propeller domain-containing protein [Ignavibacteriaceae bacterium]|nr:two-component regulator propeller domain-containing protein [Ignavibacteriaceae bacterium]